MLGKCEQFVRDIDDLRTIISSPSTTAYIRSSAILRRLLLDENPLIHAVNRELKVPLRFKINVNSSLDFRQILRDSGAEWGFSSHRNDETAQLVKLDEFLKSPIMYLDHEAISVRVFIKFVANNLGGVHFETSDDEDMERLRSIGSILRVNHIPVLLHPLIEVCSVVTEAVEEIYRRLRC